jgi:branched-chain amino acid transport system substrate-binding protein
MSTAATNPVVTQDPRRASLSLLLPVLLTDPYVAPVWRNCLPILGKRKACSSPTGQRLREGMKVFFVKQSRIWEARSPPSRAIGAGSGLPGQITAAKAAGGDVVFVTGGYKDMALIIKQCAEMDWNPAFIGGDATAPPCRDAGAPWRAPMGLQRGLDDPILVPYAKAYENAGSTPGMGGRCTPTWPHGPADAAKRPLRQRRQVTGAS